MLYSRTWLLICFIYSSLCLIPNSGFIPPPPAFPFGKFVFYVPFLKKVGHSLLTECLLCTKLSARVLTSATSLNPYSIQERNVVSCQFCSWKDRLRVWRMGHALGKTLKITDLCLSLCQHHLWVPSAVLPLLTTQDSFLSHSYPRLALPGSGPYSSPFSNF